MRYCKEQKKSVYLVFFSFRPCYVYQFSLLILLNHKWSLASFRFYMDLGMNVLIVSLLFHMLD